MGEVNQKEKKQASLSVPPSIFPSLPVCRHKKATLGSPDLNNMSLRGPLHAFPPLPSPICRVLPVCAKDLLSLTYLFL